MLKLRRKIDNVALKPNKNFVARSQKLDRRYKEEKKILLWTDRKHGENWQHCLIKKYYFLSFYDHLTISTMKKHNVVHKSIRKKFSSNVNKVDYTFKPPEFSFMKRIEAALLEYILEIKLATLHTSCKF